MHTAPFLLTFAAAMRALQLLSCCSAGGSVLSTEQRPSWAWAWAAATSPSSDGGGGGGGGGEARASGHCCGWLAGDWALCAFIAACMLAQAGLYFMTAQVRGGARVTIPGYHGFHYPEFPGCCLCCFTGPARPVLCSPSVVYLMHNTSCPACSPINGPPGVLSLQPPFAQGATL